jgi:hypothetical protein
MDGGFVGTSRKWTVKNYLSLSLLLGILGAPKACPWELDPELGLGW